MSDLPMPAGTDARLQIQARLAGILTSPVASKTAAVPRLDQGCMNNQRIDNRADGALAASQSQRLEPLMSGNTVMATCCA